MLFRSQIRAASGAARWSGVALGPRVLARVPPAIHLTRVPTRRACAVDAPLSPLAVAVDRTTGHRGGVAAGEEE